jgi:hypothetical protein
MLQIWLRMTCSFDGVLPSCDICDGLPACRPAPIAMCSGMVESAFEFADICRKHDYHNFVFSMKASNPLVMVQVGVPPGVAGAGGCPGVCMIVAQGTTGAAPASRLASAHIERAANHCACFGGGGLRCMPGSVLGLGLVGGDQAPTARLARVRVPPPCPTSLSRRCKTQAYRLLAEEMYKKGWDYPLHLGVTGGCVGVGACGC